MHRPMQAGRLRSGLVYGVDRYLAGAQASCLHPAIYTNRAKPEYHVSNVIDSFFKISERGSSIKTELLGGLTTFMTMAYIIVVNPAILSFAGLPTGPSTTATILTAVFGTLLMGVFANLPIAVAPYMGENAFVAFGLA